MLVSSLAAVAGVLSHGPIRQLMAETQFLNFGEVARLFQVLVTNLRI